MKRAILDKKIKVKFYNPRDFAENKHDRVDRKPYGGGPGMVIQAEPVIRAIDKAHSNVLKNIRMSKKLQTRPTEQSFGRAKNYKPARLNNRSGGLKTSIVWLSPSGKQFTNDYAKKMAGKFSDIIIICGRYEGIDARVKKVFKVEEISVGPFVSTGGELPAMLLIDVISRQVPGVLGDINSLEESRVSSSDVYTRPEVFKYKGKNFRVPKILLSGHRAKIDLWKQSKQK